MNNWTSTRLFLVFLCCFQEWLRHCYWRISLYHRVLPSQPYNLRRVNQCAENQRTSISFYPHKSRYLVWQYHWHLLQCLFRLHQQAVELTFFLHWHHRYHISYSKIVQCTNYQVSNDPHSDALLTWFHIRSSIYMEHFIYITVLTMVLLNNLEPKMFPSS